MTKKLAASPPADVLPSSDERQVTVSTYLNPTTIQAAIALIPSTDGFFRTKHGKVVSKRLTASQDALDALYAIGPDDDVVGDLILACIEAEHLKQTFHLRIARAQAMHRKLLALTAAAGDLLKFVDTLESGKDFLPAEIVLEGAAVSTIKAGIKEMKPWLMACRADAKRVAPRLGATRKAKMRQAAETAAIGWLASAVQSACGRPHYKEVSLIAETVLQTAEAVSIDRIRKAVLRRASGRLTPKKND